MVEQGSAFDDAVQKAKMAIAHMKAAGSGMYGHEQQLEVQLVPETEAESEASQGSGRGSDRSRGRGRGRGRDSGRGRGRGRGSDRSRGRGRGRGTGKGRGRGRGRGRDSGRGEAEAGAEAGANAERSEVVPLQGHADRLSAPICQRAGDEDKSMWVVIDAGSDAGAADVDDDADARNNCTTDAPVPALVISVSPPALIARAM